MSLLQWGWNFLSRAWLFFKFNMQPAEWSFPASIAFWFMMFKCLVYLLFVTCLMGKSLQLVFAIPFSQKGMGHLVVLSWFWWIGFCCDLLPSHHRADRMFNETFGWDFQLYCLWNAVQCLLWYILSSGGHHFLGGLRDKGFFNISLFSTNHLTWQSIKF